MNKYLLLLSLFFSVFSQAAEQITLLTDVHLSASKKKLLQQAATTSNFTLNMDSATHFRTQKSNACQAQLVIFEALSPTAAAESYQGIEALFKPCAQQKRSSVGFDAGKLNQGFSAEQSKTVAQYLNNGRQVNYDNLFVYLRQQFFKGNKVAGKPLLLPENGIYNGQTDSAIIADIKTLLKKSPPATNQAVIAVAMHRSNLESEDTRLVDETLNALRKQGAYAFGIFYEGDETANQYLLQLRGHVHALINQRMLHEADKAAALYQQLGIPVLHTLIYREGDENSFRQATAGVSAMMSPYFLMMPESAGIIDPTIIASTAADRTQQPLDYQIDALAQRAIAQARLQLTPNAEKRLAMLMWNYPPGEKNIGAAFLNVPESVKNITAALKQAGYQVEAVAEKKLTDSIATLLRPFYRSEDFRQLESQGLIDYFPVADYQTWFAQLPDYVQKPILQRWGKLGDQPYIMQKDGKQMIAIARLQAGNLILLPQPSRADKAEDHKALYHDTAAAINHYYLAVYLYLRSQYKAHALIHLGTHGSQEWLPGKERGLSIYDAPSLTAGNLPVIYPYIMDNVGEAMQAKRRGRAVMISHMTPGFAAAGDYGKITELHELVHQYQALSEGEAKEKTADYIVAKALELNIHEDIDYPKEKMRSNFAAFLAPLHDHLHVLAQASQPLGMHSFGDTLNNSHIITTILQTLGADFETAASEFERTNELQVKNKEISFNQKLADNKTLQLDGQPGFKLLWLSLIEHKNYNLPAPLAAQLTYARELFGRYTTQSEMQGLLDALNGKYMPVNFGGDPIRSPEAMPTGKNLIGFNPAKVPTKAAWEVGFKMTQELIHKHRAEQGQWPDKLAFSLWSLETMRHQGVLESQILAALGVRPLWDERGNLKGTEIIPYAELKRPRVDVVVSATGLYRDAFPNVMLLIAKGVEQVAQLKEENNSVYANSQRLQKALLKQGKTAEDARYLSSVRIFSNQSGTYGSGLADTSLASDSWEKDDKLADLYLKRMGYAFGSDEKRWNEQSSNLYRDNLSGTDAVVFSRSTNLYGLTTSDDPFQYFGGLNLAIRNIDGKDPQMYISNLRQTGNVKTETLKTFMAVEMRSRAFHPRWIEELKKEGYAGSLEMLDRINNFWGWEVMSPDAITDAQWQEFADIYVKDKYNLGLREWFEKQNPTALAQMIERMLEANRKGYWQTDAETLKQLTRTYLEIAQTHDVFTANKTFTEHSEKLAQGFGLDMAALKAAGAAMAQQANAAAQQQANTAEQQQVSGQKLEQVEKAESGEVNYAAWLAGLFMFALLAAGALWQKRETQFA